MDKETVEYLKVNSEKQIQPIILDILGAMCIVSNIQLASRHPGNIGPSSNIAQSIAKEIQKSILEVAPNLAEVLEKGWNPEFDVPV